MAKITQKQADQIIKMRAEGTPWKQVISITGVSHSIAELTVMQAEYFGGGHKALALTPEVVGALRFLGFGWGPIMVATGTEALGGWTPEGQVRKAWEALTGNLAEGQRIGRGGRFLADERDPYRVVAGSINTQRTGFDLLPGQSRYEGLYAAWKKALLTEAPKALKAMCDELSIGYNAKSFSRAKAVIAIAERMAGIEAAEADAAEAAEAATAEA